jgi:hypothetical protein
VLTTGDVTTGFLANESARIAAAWTKWSAARMAFQRNRLADRSAGIER